MTPFKTRQWEQSTVGFDPELQLVGSDAQSGDASLGLAIPTARPANAQGRYTFLLAVAQFGIDERAHLVGMRQFLRLGNNLEFPLKCQVKSPTWRFVDGNVTWSLRRIKPMLPGFFNVNNADGLQWRMGPSPAQLFETVTGGVILPPYAGDLPGDALEPNFEQFYDIRFPWQRDNAPESLDCPVVGPCQIALFASVMQSDPQTRLAGPGGLTLAMGYEQEAVFLSNNPTAIYDRIAGSLIFKQERGAPAFKPNSEKYPARIQTPDSALIRGYDERH